MLGYHEWLDGLTRGIAAHHAGMLPTFKEVVEELFQRGLVKAVFATETLALGINMPARSVVLERLVKWNGETHADLTPGEYTQLTGRAGRRGIDVEGHAVVLWQAGLDPRAVGGLASTRTYPLRSSFRPSYNMAVNLVGSVGRHTAREILESSFAQFQADRAVVGLARQVRRNEEALTGYREAMTCHLGDFGEYSALRRTLSDREAELSRQGAAQRKAAAAASLESLRIGDVIRVPAGKRSGLAVVLDPGLRQRGGRRSTAGGAHRRAPGGPALAGRLPVPGRAARADAGAEGLQPALAAVPPGPRRNPALEGPRQRQRPRRTAAGAGGGRRRPDRQRAPGRDPRGIPATAATTGRSHARWAERYHRLATETSQLEQRVESRTNTIARTFDRVCGLLESLGYLDGDQVTAGRRAAGPALQRAGPAGRRVPP